MVPRPSDLECLLQSALHQWSKFERNIAADVPTRLRSKVDAEQIFLDSLFEWISAALEESPRKPATPNLLYTIVQHRLQDAIRKERRQKWGVKIEFENHDELMFVIDPRSTDPLTKLEYQQTLSRLNWHLDE